MQPLGLDQMGALSETFSVTFEPVLFHFCLTYVEVSKALKNTYCIFVKASFYSSTTGPKGEGIGSDMRSRYVFIESDLGQNEFFNIGSISWSHF